MNQLPERDFPPGRHRLLKEHLMTEIRRADDEPVGARGRWLRPVLVAGAVVAVAAATLVAPFDREPAASKEAVALLEDIAAGAARAHDAQRTIRDDQFVYIRSRIAYTTQENGGPEKLDPVHTREIWLSVDGTRTGLLEEDIDGNEHVELERSAGGGRSTYYRDLAKLPTDTGKMYDWLYETSGEQVDDEHRDRDEEAFVLFGDLIQESLMPPEVGDALYRAAARIPGVEVVRGATDSVGRKGVAITRRGGSVHVQLIFDERTSAFLGERELDEDGKIRGISAIIERGVVDKAGQRP